MDKNTTARNARLAISTKELNAVIKACKRDTTRLAHRLILEAHRCDELMKFEDGADLISQYAVPGDVALAAADRKLINDAVHLAKSAVAESIMSMWLEAGGGEYQLPRGWSEMSLRDQRTHAHDGAGSGGADGYGFWSDGIGDYLVEELNEHGTEFNDEDPYAD